MRIEEEEKKYRRCAESEQVAGVGVEAARRWNNKYLRCTWTTGSGGARILRSQQPLRELDVVQPWCLSDSRALEEKKKSERVLTTIAPRQVMKGLARLLGLLVSTMRPMVAFCLPSLHLFSEVYRSNMDPLHKCESALFACSFSLLAVYASYSGVQVPPSLNQQP